MKITDEMVDRFLAWKLPKSVLPDACVMDREYPHRIGTNLLTADEARQMLEHVLGSMPNAEAVRAWIPASERLPEVGDKVVVWDAAYDDAFPKAITAEIRDGWHASRFTHWMPLPASPSHVAASDDSPGQGRP